LTGAVSFSKFESPDTETVIFGTTTAASADSAELRGLDVGITEEANSASDRKSSSGSDSSLGLSSAFALIRKATTSGGLSVLTTSGGLSVLTTLGVERIPGEPTGIKDSGRRTEKLGTQGTLSRELWDTGDLEGDAINDVRYPVNCCSGFTGFLTWNV
jgi:hypothetical protein